MSQRKTKDRSVNTAKEPHYRIAFFAMQSASNQKRAKDRYESDSNDPILLPQQFRCFR